MEGRVVRLSQRWASDQKKLSVTTEGLPQRHGLRGRCPDLKAYAWQPGAGQAILAPCWQRLWAYGVGRLGRDSPRKPRKGYVEPGRHNAQCLPLWKQSGPMLSAGCAHVGPILGLCWAKSGPCWAIGPILGLCWAKLGPCWAMLGPSWAHVLGLCWPTLSHLGSYVGATFGPSMLKRS